MIGFDTGLGVLLATELMRERCLCEGGRGSDRRSGLGAVAGDVILWFGVSLVEEGGRRGK